MKPDGSIKLHQILKAKQNIIKINKIFRHLLLKMDLDGFIANLVKVLKLSWGLFSIFS